MSNVARLQTIVHSSQPRIPAILMVLALTAFALLTGVTVLRAAPELSVTAHQEEIH